ncbi:MAG: alkene reductase [Bacteroidales bacterium]|jgi:N-ethylmaleimide reductase|nr:alkene reductase [Bacteroidales bacterium]
MPVMLLTPFQLGKIMLPNRIIMAPLTRSRATIEGVPTPMMAEHYSKRASAGLIIAEACNISRQGTGYPFTPGIYTEEMIEGWRAVTAAVHDAGGRIYLQLWHVGRHSHPYYHGGKAPVAPSAILEDGSIKTPEGIKDTVLPRALEIKEIHNIIQDYGQAAANAIEAGFDGVEVHGANGYLIDQFLQDATNKRVDEYGGSMENRSRFLFEVISEVTRRIGAARTGLRLSPSGIKLDVSDKDPVGLFSYVIDKLNEYKLAYLHIMEPYVDVSHLPHYLQDREITPFFRKIYRGTLMTNVGFDAESGEKTLREGHADLIAYGKAFISNPDLVQKFRTGAPLTPWDTETFYTQGEKGYNDYE